MFQKLWRGKSSVQVRSDNSLHESKILKLDNTKMKKKLGVKPKMSFEEALCSTVQWYEEFYYKKNICLAYVKGSLKDYEGLILEVEGKKYSLKHEKFPIHDPQSIKLRS